VLIYSSQAPTAKRKMKKKEVKITIIPERANETSHVARGGVGLLGLGSVI
jgi:hypothetical protein